MRVRERESQRYVKGRREIDRQKVRGSERKKERGQVQKREYATRLHLNILLICHPLCYFISDDILFPFRCLRQDQVRLYLMVIFFSLSLILSLTLLLFSSLPREV